MFNFGAIKKTCPERDGWIDIDKVSVFIGNQGSGKSTLAKLISTFLWIEKALVRGDYDEKYFQRKNKFVNQFVKYRRLDKYLCDDSYIEYLGYSKHIIFEGQQLSIKNSKLEQNYILPQIMYVPVERNFIAYVKNSKELRILSESMQEFVAEFNNAKNAIKQSILLPINDIYLEYDRLNDKLNLKGADYKIHLSDSASGFQSSVPLLLVSDYLAKSVDKSKTTEIPMSEKERENFSKGIQHILENTHFSEEQHRLAISLLSAKFNKNAFINIVEEPEQNLFPTSQWEILKELLRFNRQNKNNHLILATHSPYIINYLSIAIKAEQTFKQLMRSGQSEDVIHAKVDKIVPDYCWLNSEDVSIYQLKDSIVELLPEIYGIPSDDNDLNNMLAEGNDIIDQLMELEDDYQFY